MNDAELSLAVARIMWPEYEWESWTLLADKSEATARTTLECAMKEHGKTRTFDHTTDDALGKMCVFGAKHKPMINVQVILWQSDNPHRSIAEAIVETAL